MTNGISHIYNVLIYNVLYGQTQFEDNVSSLHIENQHDLECSKIKHQHPLAIARGFS